MLNLAAVISASQPVSISQGTNHKPILNIKKSNILGIFLGCFKKRYIPGRKKGTKDNLTPAKAPSKTQHKIPDRSVFFIEKTKR